MTKKKHDEDTTTIERAKQAVRGIDGRQAAIAGAGVAAGLAIGAALFANWRKSSPGGARLTSEPQVDTPADDAALAIGAEPGLTGGTLEVAQDSIGGQPDVTADAVGSAAGAELDPDGAKLHAMGTPTTLPIDGGVQSYTGDRHPDLVIPYLPEGDAGSTDAANTRDR